MFDHSENSRVFGLPPGVDFPRALVEGLNHRLKGKSPDAMAQVELIVNTRRMARRLREIFDAGPALLLPRIRLITETSALSPTLAFPPAHPPLRLRLDLIRLVSALLAQNPEIAPRASLYDLADSLAALMDEMQGEGVSPDAIANLDVSDQSGHWDRTKTFIGIVQSYLEQTAARPDTETRQRQIVEVLAVRWAENPPKHPIIIAGSTGSRGTTMLLMKAVSKLPQGALILPGFDTDLPAGLWAELDNPVLSEDHPQFRFHRLLGALSLTAQDVVPWHDTPPPVPDRNRLISLSLRPAPVTDAWRTEGPRLGGIDKATQGLTLVQAENPRMEALAIALRLRQAVQDRLPAALITPDRMLTRRVTAALSRWGIVPDDSAGTPLQLSPPGRFLRHVAGLFSQKLDAETLLTVLKHPLTHSGQGRNYHQLYTQRLELAIRRNGLPYPTADGLRNLMEKAASKNGDRDEMQRWSEWIIACMTGREIRHDRPLAECVALHIEIAERLAAGTDPTQEGLLWKRTSGEEAHKVMEELGAQAEHGGAFSAPDYSDLFGALLSQSEVRDKDAPHPGVMIWGTLEARVQGAGLVILGGLNDGTWPEAPQPDPWLNRMMRAKAGLLLPERRIGLSAHDYQQAVCAPEVWLTRAIRSDDAETVPSRWLNRLGNLLQGLPSQGGDVAFAQMVGRGAEWLSRAKALEQVDRVAPAPRPSPRPPLSARPKQLSVTEIKTLIRNPYAVYARHCLKLRPLRPLVQSPDAPLRGVVVHKVMERFIRDVVVDPSALTKERLLKTATEVLAEAAPWPAARTIWMARLERVADWFIAAEKHRQSTAQPIAFERGAQGSLTFADLGFVLTCVADRIDRDAAGHVQVYDYKTGSPPTKKEQKHFDKQLLIEAAMIEEGAFELVGAAAVSRAAYIGLGSKPKEEDAPLDEEPPAKVLGALRDLISSYLETDQGYTARRMMQLDGYGSDYDQLSRFGEWDTSEDPKPEDLT